MLDLLLFPFVGSPKTNLPVWSYVTRRSVYIWYLDWCILSDCLTLQPAPGTTQLTSGLRDVHHNNLLSWSQEETLHFESIFGDVIQNI